MKLSLVALVSICTMFSSCTSTEIQKEEETVSTLDSVETELYELVNIFRAENGLEVFVYNNSAQTYAREHNAYMISRNAISHDNFVMRSSDLSVKLNAVKVSENVGRYYDTAEEVFKAWTNSEKHVKNILGDYRETAISVSEDDNGGLYFTQIFIK